MLSRFSSVFTSRRYPPRPFASPNLYKVTFISRRDDIFCANLKSCFLRRFFICHHFALGFWCRNRRRARFYFILPVSFVYYFHFSLCDYFIAFWPLAFAALALPVYSASINSRFSSACFKCIPGGQFCAAINFSDAATIFQSAGLAVIAAMPTSCAFMLRRCRHEKRPATSRALTTPLMQAFECRVALHYLPPRSSLLPS